MSLDSEKKRPQLSLALGSIRRQCKRHNPGFRPNASLSRMGGGGYMAEDSASPSVGASINRNRELRHCADFFNNMAKRTIPDACEQHSLNTAAYNNMVFFGIPLSPQQAMRMPHLVKQPKPWVQEIYEMVSDGSEC